jgi:flagellar motor switch protein FliM
MADEVLTAEELDALLATVEEAGSGRRKREKRVSEYDFVRPNKLSGEQLRSLQRLHEAISQSLTMALSSYLRINIEFNIVSLGELTFEVFRNSLPNPTVINILSLAPLPERALATMDIKLAFSLIDRMLGGPGKPLDKARALTTLEQALLDNVVRRFLEKLAEGWHDLCQFTPEVESREMDPQFVQVIPSSEMVLVSTFSISAPGELEPGEMCVCIPFISLDGVLARLGNQFRFASMKRDQTPDQRRWLDKVVRGTAIPVRALLGTSTLSLGEVLALKPGDVVVLDQTTLDPVRVEVRGKLRAEGRAGRSGRHLGVHLDTVYPAGTGPIDKE